MKTTMKTFTSLDALMRANFFDDQKVNVNVSVSDHDTFFSAELVDRWALNSVHIINTGEFFSSEDGQMLFQKDVDGNVNLILCLDNQRKVVIPDGVSVIRRCAFSENDMLEEVEIPDSVREIRACAFSDCKNLKKVILSKNLRMIGNSAFMNSGIERVVFPRSLAEVEDYAFCGCENLKEVIFREGSRAAKILDFAFAECTQLSHVELPSNLREIGKGIFKGCNSLSVTLPEAVKTRKRTVKVSKNKKGIRAWLSGERKVI